jgi:hypothetical protein
MKFYFQISWFTDPAKTFFDKDYYLVLFFLENIVRFGDIYCNNTVGHPQIDVFCFNDYNNDNAWINYLIIKFLALFSKNSMQLVIWYFFLAQF